MPGKMRMIHNNDSWASRDMQLVVRVINLLADRGMTLQQKLDMSLKMILEGIGALNGSIMIIDQTEAKLKVWAATNKDIICKKQPVSEESISGCVFLRNEPIFIRDINKHPDFAPKARPDNYRTSSLICVPLATTGEDKPFGVINVSDRNDSTWFSSQDFALLMDYAAWISPLLENTFLVEDLAREKERYKRLSYELEIKQKELMISTSERSELIQMVVHDFKSPLSAVISNLDLLSYMGLSQEQQPVVKTAVDGSKKLLEMINEFLDVARLDHWQETGELKDISLMGVVKEELEEVFPVARKKKIFLEVAEVEDVVVHAHENLLQHLVKNLLSNAVKYTPDNGAVRIYWTVKKARRLTDRCTRLVTLCVEDSGPGVPEEMKKSIFDRFTRVKRDRHIQGSGVGLFICNRIATIMGGKIWVEDVLSGGSRFCVTMFAPEDGCA